MNGRRPTPLTVEAGWLQAWLSLLAGTLLVALACPDAAMADQPEVPSTTDREGSQADSWDVQASLSAYLFANQADFLQPTVALERGVHLEARYNYEALRTGSVWLGWSFESGKGPKLALTPVVVGVVGNLHGVAPGFEADLSWGPVELYWEGEYILDVTYLPGSDFLTQSELSARPVEWLRAGVAAQRNRAVREPRQLQWGVLVGVSFWKLNASAYWFDPGQAHLQYCVASLGVSF
jgi:hypothetical protein